ncbi:NADH:ubiquinone oxidoreductase [Desulforhopalus vacuolatus]|uniref:NADH-quinone oxidoreductase subunit B family protein n=1 Tax=Desulforhopalus vacuolatus TaxID=40414 RepID=UPI0019632237|nr:NADH:ubiquinone oxidoreductase [Desulforhopalus vacuolatus]MBM9520356.1 NADH:ubiquinone oxidoreductase [Desulforhopalus vacuolatus]
MKPRVAVFDFASCEGCELQLFNLEEKFLDLIKIVDVVSFREGMKEHSDLYDIAVIDGSIMRPMDVERLKIIRKKAKTVVALGACACIGGVNKLRNQWTSENVRREVYGDANLEGNPLFDIFPARAVDEVVKVDYYVPGCPIDRAEFTKVITAVIMGREPRLPSYPVCVECKLRENQCVFELGMFCLGPITRAGCNAICPTHRKGCAGCRGFLEDANMDAFKDVLRKYKIPMDEWLKCFDMFNCKIKREK